MTELYFIDSGRGVGGILCGKMLFLTTKIFTNVPPLACKPWVLQVEM